LFNGIAIAALVCITHAIALVFALGEVALIPPNPVFVNPLEARLKAGSAC
jgi:hypothetical protein